MTKLRALWHNILATYWFFPALFAIAAVALAFGTIWLDRTGWAERLSQIGWLIPARPDGAANMLTVIAGSMIGVASTVFSITIAAVAYASGNYGPRLLTNFMEDRGNQFSLATFIGTFVYALTVLRTVRQENEPVSVLMGTGETALPGFVPQLSLLTAYALTGISVAVLVFFLNHIPDSIRINSVLHGVGKRLLRVIEKRYPDEDCGAEPMRADGGVPIIAQAIGYIQLVDYEGLHEAAREAGGCLIMAVRTGDFIHPDMVVARWRSAQTGEGGAGEGFEQVRQAVKEGLALGSRRTPSQDADFLIDELVEIALRALSPGINDPFTAITAIHWLGAATAELGARDLRMRGFDGNGHEDNCVVPLGGGYDYYVSRGFGALRSGVATNRIAALRFLDALGDSASTLANESRRERLVREAAVLMEQMALNLQGPELHEVQARHQSLLVRLAQ